MTNAEDQAAVELAYPHIVIYTSINSLGYDVQVWMKNYKSEDYDVNAVTLLTGNRFSTRAAGHAWADEWLDKSVDWHSIRRVHEL